MIWLSFFSVRTCADSGRLLSLWMICMHKATTASVRFLQINKVGLSQWRVLFFANDNELGYDQVKPLLSRNYTASSNCSNPWLDIPRISSYLAASRLIELTKYKGQPQNLPADPVYHPKDPLLSNLSLGSTPLISPSQFEALCTTTT